MRRNLGMLHLMAQMAMGQTGPVSNRRTKVAPDNPREVQPKGTKEYRFDIDGKTHNYTFGDDIVFKCYAINDKNARRKFNSWKNKNQII